jgi:hypothetical protein
MGRERAGRQVRMKGGRFGEGVLQSRPNLERVADLCGQPFGLSLGSIHDHRIAKLSREGIPPSNCCPYAPSLLVWKRGRREGWQRHGQLFE